MPIFGETDPVTRLPPAETMTALTNIFQQLIAAQIPAASPYQALVIGDGSATLPVRPSTPQPVIFNTSSTPPLTGTISGGTTGRVAGLDVWLGGTGGGGGGTPSLVLTENPVGSGSYPNRPASTAQVTWQGVVAPVGGGTVSGGTPLMVSNIDVWDQWVLG